MTENIENTENVNVTVKKTDQDTIVQGYYEKDGVTTYICKKNGRLVEKGSFRDYERHGLWISYGEDGQVEKKAVWENGHEKGRVFYENGQPKSVEIRTMYSQKTYGSQETHGFKGSSMSSSTPSYFSTTPPKSSSTHSSGPSYFSTGSEINSPINSSSSSYFSTRQNSSGFKIRYRFVPYEPDHEKAKNYMGKIDRMEEEQRSAWDLVLSRVCPEEQKQATISQQSSVLRNGSSPTSNDRPHS